MGVTIIGKSWHDGLLLSAVLPATPVVVLTTRLAHANIERWQSQVNQAGMHTRPHLKGDKTVALAEHQLALGATGFEVSRVREL